MKKMIINPDTKYANSIKESIKNLKGQCPCVPSYEWNNDTICPCKKFRTEQLCHCNLFIEEV